MRSLSHHMMTFAIARNYSEKKSQQLIQPVASESLECAIDTLVKVFHFESEGKALNQLCTINLFLIAKDAVAKQLIHNNFRRKRSELPMKS